jgi:hypothetical protein
MWWDVMQRERVHHGYVDETSLANGEIMYILKDRRDGVKQAVKNSPIESYP